ncbi:MAG: hypothetical protein IPJ34_27905 [Myxococcales bacterium]|nr:hypothetical protein [Myxococcales bacterium]
MHGIAVATLASAPPFASIAAVVEILDGAVPVAHAAEWDPRVPARRAERVGPAGPTHALDTLVVARRAFFQPSYALAALARAFAIDPGTAHRAGDDVRTLRGVYAHVVKELSPSTPRDLWMVRIGENEPRPGVVAACQEAVTRGTPVQVTYRPASSGPKEFGMVMTAVDGPHVHGFMVPSRGRRTLLLARVLRVEPLPPLSWVGKPGRFAAHGDGYPGPRDRCPPPRPRRSFVSDRPVFAPVWPPS